MGGDERKYGSPRVGALPRSLMRPPPERSEKKKLALFAGGISAGEFVGAKNKENKKKKKKKKKEKSTLGKWAPSVPGDFA